MQRTSIWFLIPTLEIGGAERTLVELVNNMNHDEFEITLWTITRGGPLRKELNSEVEYRCLNAHGRTDIMSVYRFIREVRQSKPDILQSFTFFDNLFAGIVSVFAPNTIVITGVRVLVKNQPTHRTLLNRIALRFTDYVVSNSDVGAQQAMDRGVKAENVQVIRNGRNIDKYRNGQATDELYNTLNLDSESPIIGTVGRLVERKGHYDLLDAWPTIRKDRPESQLLIVGYGPERRDLEQRVKNLGCSESVVFTGQRDDIPDLLDAMDVFVFPSHYEGLPGALIEAMIVGLPIVATPVDGNSELIEDCITGLFVPPHDSNSLANKVQCVLNDSYLQEELGAAASEYAREEFATERMVAEFEQLYRDVI